jgi:hypothetical protein
MLQVGPTDIDRQTDRRNKFAFGSVGKLTRRRVQGSRVQFLECTRDFLFSTVPRQGLTYPMGTGGSVPGGREVGA